VQLLSTAAMSNMAAVRIAYSRERARYLQLPAAAGNSTPAHRLRRNRRPHPHLVQPNLDSQYYFVRGSSPFLVMLLSLLFTLHAVVREKEAGTMEQLVVTRSRPPSSSPAKTIPFILIARPKW